MNGYPFTKPRWLALKDHIERNFAASDIDHNGVVDCLSIMLFSFTSVLFTFYL